MPYAATVTPSLDVFPAPRRLLVTVTEPACEATSEWSLDLRPYIPSGKFKILRVVDLKTAGDAATIAPVFGTATNPTAGTLGYLGTAGAAAVSHNSTNNGIFWTANGTTLYGRSVPNAGVNNAITTVFHIVEAWG